MRKIIILMISIIVPIIGAILIGVYDYNVWYDPEGKNSTELQSEYKKYVIEKTLEIEGKTDQEKTEDRISLYRLLENYYYSEEPVYKEDIKKGETDLFTIAIYKNVFFKVVDEKIEEDHYRYEVFVYNVNYDGIKNMFLDLTVPNDDIVNKADYPYLIINFYPDDTYTADNALITSDSGVSYAFTMYNESVLYGYKLTNSQTINLFDYGSNPTNASNPFYVRTLPFYDYSAFLDEENLDLFDDGAYIKVDAILASEANYTLKESLVQKQIEDFTLDRDEINTEDYKVGATNSVSIHEVLNNVDIKGVKNYDFWVFSRYLWWQCLIALVIFGLIMTGFYFTFTYEETGKIRNKYKKKVHKN